MMVIRMRSPPRQIKALRITILAAVGISLLRQLTLALSKSVSPPSLRQLSAKKPACPVMDLVPC